MGDILVARLKVRGAAGAVMDGGVRDYAGVAAMGLPVFAQGPAAPANVHRHHAVEANVPIGCGEVLVMPGDIMVGDGDGVVCVPRAVADKIAAAGTEQEELEAFVLAKIQAGASLRGTYPPGPETRAEFEAAKRNRALSGRRRQGTREALGIPHVRPGLRLHIGHDLLQMIAVVVHPLVDHVADREPAHLGMRAAAAQRRRRQAFDQLHAVRA